MKPFSRAALSVFGIAAIAAVLLSAPTKPAGASAGPAVTVANTPLPVTGNVNASVSGTVAVSSMPTVNAAQSGTWTVGISGTPNVNASNVTDSNGNPVPVTTQDIGYRNFFSISGNCSFSGTGCSVPGILNISGQQFAVVKSISGTCNLPSTTDSIQSISLSGAVSLTTTVVGVYVVPGPVNNGTQSFAQEIEGYFPPGPAGSQTYDLNIQDISSLSGGSCAIFVNGYWTPKPYAGAYGTIYP